MAKDFYQTLGLGVSSLTFGVALSVFILSAVSGIVIGISGWLLFATSFLLMLRLWWRYNEVFVQHSPSRNFWHFMFDFLTAFFGILVVLLVRDIQMWALIGVLAMISSMVRSGLSWKDTKIRKQLKSTVAGAIVMAIIFSVVYCLAPFVGQVNLAVGVFVLVLVFVVYSSRK